MKNWDEVIKGCKRQERKYQEILFKDFYGKLMGVSLRMAPDKGTAEDLLQDAFIKIFNKIDMVDKNNVEVVFGWCRKILSNSIIDYYRKNPFRLVSTMDEILDIEDDEGDYNYLENKGITPTMIQNAIETLSPRYKLVFSMYAIEGYQHNEVSEMLGISVSTSKSNYMKARRHLQKKLKPCLV